MVKTDFVQTKHTFNTEQSNQVLKECTEVQCNKRQRHPTKQNMQVMESIVKMSSISEVTKLNTKPGYLLVKCMKHG